MKQLIAMLKRHEGEVKTNGPSLVALQMSQAGYWTLGIGRNVDVNGGGIGLSEDEVNYLLENDIVSVLP